MLRIWILSLFGILFGSVLSEGQAGGWSFVQLCDPQLGVGGYDHDLRYFEEAVVQINQRRPDFVVICGDLVQRPTERSWEDFLRIRSGFVIPCHCAAGNHDVKNRPSADSLREYRERIGPDYYTFDHRGFTFVVVNSQLWKAPVEGESEAHDAWFRKTLASAHRRKRPIVVIAHYPLFVRSVDERETYWNLPREKRLEILELCETRGVVAFLGGHRHRFEENEYRGIQLVNGSSLSKNFDRSPLGYRWWDVDAEGQMSHRFLPIELPEEPADVAAPRPRPPKIGGRLRRP